MKITASRIKVITCIVIAVALFAIVWDALSDGIKRMHTLDDMSVVEWALDKTLYDSEWQKGYNPEEQTIKLRPDVRNSGGHILDAWGHPIKISIQNTPKAFVIRIASAGRDGKMGTKDDLVFNGTLPHGEKVQKR